MDTDASIDDVRPSSISREGAGYAIEGWDGCIREGWAYRPKNDG